jgi:hypothetical protein
MGSIGAGSEDTELAVTVAIPDWWPAGAVSVHGFVDRGYDWDG